MSTWSNWYNGSSSDSKIQGFDKNSNSGKHSAGDHKYLIRETKDRNNDSRNDYPHMIVHTDKDGNVKGAHHSESKGNQTWGTASGEYNCDGSSGGGNSNGNDGWESIGSCD